MNRRVLLAWLLATSVAWSAEPKAVVIEPATSQLGDLVILDASESEGDSFAWILECSTKTFLPVDGGKRCVFASGTPGKYAFTFIAVGVDEDGKAVLDKTRAVVTIEGPVPPPVPPGPTPPGPEPPNPPSPPIPVPAEGLRVLFIFESSANMTRQQLAVLSSADVRSFLNRTCTKSPSGLAEWRSWDKDIDVSNESATWQAIWASTKPKLGTLPQVVIFQGQQGWTYSLPDDVAGLMTLLQKHAGGSR